jgi:hypothetical protein
MSNKKIITTIFLISSIVQVIYFYAVRINFECDSAAYYNSAVGYFTNNMNLVSPYRGPIYPLILRVFEVTTNGHVYPLLIFQAILGAVMPLLVYLIIFEYGKSKAVVGSTIFMASSVPFTSAKLILAEQVFIFTIIVSVYFLNKYIIRNGNFNLLMFSAFALLASLTRWEGLALILAVCLVFIYKSIFNKSFIRPTIFVIIFFSLTLLGYSAIRAYQYNDFKMFGLQNGTGSQWLWRQYYSQGFRDFDGEIKNGSGAFKGDSIQYIYKSTVDYVLSNNPEFEALKATSKDNKNINQSYAISLENSKPNVEFLINEAWKTPSTSGSHISFLMSRAILSKHGLTDGDKILQKGALNVFISEPQAQLVVLEQGLAMIGIGNFSLDQKIQWFEGPLINIGGCLNNTGNENFIKNHNAIYVHYNSNIHSIASELRNLVRFSFPFLILVSLIQSILRKKIEILYIILILSTGFNIGIVSLTGGGPYGKYDLTIFTYIILATFTQITLPTLKSRKRF